MNDAQAESAAVVPAGRITARTVAALIAAALIPLAVILYSVSAAESARKAWRDACLAPGKETIDITGLIREREGGFYLEVGTSSHYLGKTCDGKNARACLESNPGKGRLADQLGQPASAILCDGEVLSYRVAGRAFYK